MKILAAVESSENPKILSDTVLSWLPRAGYTLRVFIPDDSQLDSYKEALSDAKYNHYVDLTEDQLVVGQRVDDYAREHGYDIVITIPQDLKEWDVTDLDKTVLNFAADVGAVRAKMNVDKSMTGFVFENGATIIRL